MIKILMKILPRVRLLCESSPRGRAAPQQISSLTILTVSIHSPHLPALNHDDDDVHDIYDVYLDTLSLSLSGHLDSLDILLIDCMQQRILRLHLNHCPNHYFICYHYSHRAVNGILAVNGSLIHPIKINAWHWDIVLVTLFSRRSSTISKFSLSIPMSRAVLL